MKRAGVLLTLGVMILALCGCGSSSELTRPKAEKIIAASPTFAGPQPLELMVNQSDMEKGVEHGYWTKNKGILGVYVTPTEKGKKVFTNFGPQLHNEPFMTTLAFKVPKQILEVTGITEAPALIAGAGNGTTKLVTFVWTYNIHSLPTDVRDLLKDLRSATATALLRLYDDGWRFERLV